MGYPCEFRELGMANTSIRCAKGVQKHPRCIQASTGAYEGAHRGIWPLALL